MQHINKEKIVPYSAANMYSLVADIEKYSDFLPYCIGSKVISSTGNNVTASIAISYLGIQQELATENVIKPHSQITMTLIKGPVAKLQGCWSFAEVNSGSSKVSLTLSFELGSRAAQLLSASVLDMAVTKVINSFINRAKQLYG